MRLLLALKLLMAWGQYFDFWMRSMPKVNCLLLRPRKMLFKMLFGESMRSYYLIACNTPKDPQGM
jgi:hypothetical protein